MTRKQIKRDYDRLDVYRGAKERAAQIHGITGDYFRKLLASDKTPQDTLLSMHQAIKQSASESLDSIKKINVELGN